MVGFPFDRSLGVTPSSFPRSGASKQPSATHFGLQAVVDRRFAAANLPLGSSAILTDSTAAGTRWGKCSATCLARPNTERQVDLGIQQDRASQTFRRDLCLSVPTGPEHAQTSGRCRRCSARGSDRPRRLRGSRSAQRLERGPLPATDVRLPQSRRSPLQPRYR